MSNRVLVVDDEPGIREALKQVLEYEKLEVAVASSGAEALSMYSEFHPHVVLLDVKMAGLDGLETLARLRDLDPGAMIVMISGHATIATAVEATRRGAFDFLEKPLDSDRLLVTIRNAMTHEEVSTDYRRLRKESDARHTMVGDGPGLKAVREIIARTAPTAARVLITGENGTGKELVARAIHDNSPRRSRPFVEVNCAAIPSELIESELFGHVKGSFTGAVADREGRFEQADEGTIFLDEIGDMAPSAQAKVLRALQEGVITRVGGTKPVQVDVRIIAATNKNLTEEIAAGRFRQDLYYRLNVVPIHVPALRERREDVPTLVQHFVRQMTGAGGAARKVIDPAAVEILKKRRWPGNVRELRNAVERLLILAPGKTILAKDVGRLLGDLSTELVVSGADGTLEAFMLAAEKNYVATRLAEFGWNISDTARALGIPRTGLYKKMQRLGLEENPQ